MREGAMKAVVRDLLGTETMGKMPELRRLTMAPFAMTRQTLPVLLDGCVSADDFPVGIAKCADWEGVRL